MRILHVIPALRVGGAERLALDICKALNEEPDTEAELVAFRLETDLPQYISGNSFRVIPASVQLSITKKKQVNVSALNSFIESYRPDIIHTHLFAAELVAREHIYEGVKYFTHCHDNMHQLMPFSLSDLFSKKRITELYERNYLIKKYRSCGNNRFLAISKNTEDYFHRVLPPDLQQITLLHNAINHFEYTRPHNFYKQTTNKLQLVSIGRLVPRKNQQMGVDVVKELLEMGVDVHLHILGDGPDREMIQKKINGLKLEKSVTLHGDVSGIPHRLWNADIFLHTATYEPFGLVLLEAMSAGLPVVSLDGLGNRVLIDNNKNGYLLTKQNPKLFAEKIAMLWQNKVLYNQMAENAVQFAAQYDIKVYIKKLTALYRESLQKS